MDAETAMDAGAGQADEDAEFRGCPLGRGGVAVAADVILGHLLQIGQL